MTTTRELDGLKVTIGELWTLSVDGMTLRVDAVVTTPSGREEPLAKLGIFILAFTYCT